MRNLLLEPLWEPHHLGAPIPESPHAVSVCLPTWRDNIGYEEGDRRVHDRLSTGYPRFVYNRWCRELFAECERRFARDDETCLAFPTRGAAERFARCYRQLTVRNVRLESLDAHGAWAALFPRSDATIAKAIWQHTGEGITSRQAAACLNQAEAIDGAAAKAEVRNRIAGLAGVPVDNVFLFSCGMSAIAAVQRVVTQLFSGRSTVQFGFPYVDTLKIQEKFGVGAHFLRYGEAADLQNLARITEREPLAGLYTEFPSNPLLVSSDLGQLADLARRHEFPLIVDDTLSGYENADLRPVADVICTSLTKFFSGLGDVTAGAVLLNPRSAFHADLSGAFRNSVEDTVWGADAVAIERNSRDYAARVRRIDANALAVVEFLREHPRVERVYHPSLVTREQYDAYRRPEGGYGGLFSLTLRDGGRAAPIFYDNLRVSKGPNLGMSYTLACPYTLLAHYQELDFAESCGVSRHLVRVSIGTEEPGDLVERFAEALEETN